MYIIIHKHGRMETSYYFPSIDPDKFAEGDADHIIISLFSSTIKVPKLDDTEAAPYITYEEFKLPLEGLKRFMDVALARAENPMDDTNRIVENYAHIRYRKAKAQG
jgi:hypothetical protein